MFDVDEGSFYAVLFCYLFDLDRDDASDDRALDVALLRAVASDDPPLLPTVELDNVSPLRMVVSPTGEPPYPRAGFFTVPGLGFACALTASLSCSPDAYLAAASASARASLKELHVLCHCLCRCLTATSSSPFSYTSPMPPSTGVHAMAPCLRCPCRGSHSFLSSARRKQSVLYASKGHAADNISSAAAFTSANVASDLHVHSTLRDGGAKW